jgi:hypothetical protein
VLLVQKLGGGASTVPRRSRSPGVDRALIAALAERLERRLDLDRRHRSRGHVTLGDTTLPGRSRRTVST